MYFIRFLLIGIWGICCTNVWGASNPADPLQTENLSAPTFYRISDKVSFLEINAMALASVGNITDAEDVRVTRVMKGWSGNVFLPLCPALALGAQFEKIKSADANTSLLTPIKREAWSVLVRWTMIAYRTPQLYMLLGAGTAQYRTRFPLSNSTFNSRSTVLIAGLGMRVNIWKELYLVGEYQFQYDTKRWENAFLRGPHGRQHWAAGISYGF